VGVFQILRKKKKIQKRTKLATAKRRTYVSEVTTSIVQRFFFFLF